MNLTVIRDTFTGHSTIGQLLVDGVFECFTLEDMTRPVKVPGVTAIPEGVFVVSVSFSARFKRVLPEVHDVPNFTGVRIHTGNTDANTEGCILVGTTKTADFIGGSRSAFATLFPKIQAAAQREKIFLEVTSAAPAAPGAGPRGLPTRGEGAGLPVGRAVRKRTVRKRAVRKRVIRRHRAASGRKRGTGPRRK